MNLFFYGIVTIILLLCPDLSNDVVHELNRQFNTHLDGITMWWVGLLISYFSHGVMQAASNECKCSK